MAEICASSHAAFRSLAHEDLCRDLMREIPETRCQWLAEANEGVFLRDGDWEKIFDDIFDDPEPFVRYHPMTRVVVDMQGRQDVVRALVTNDDLWHHVARLADDLGVSQAHPPHDAGPEMARHGHTPSDWLGLKELRCSLYSDIGRGSAGVTHSSITSASMSRRSRWHIPGRAHRP